MPRAHGNHDLALEALRTENELFWTILDVVGALVVVLDREGRIVFFNRACERATGYSANELKGIPFWDRLLMEQEVQSIKAVFAQLKAGHFPNEHENYWVAKDGTRRWIRWTNTAVLGKDDSVRYVVGTGIDITERKRMEVALQERELELRKFSQTVEQSPSTVMITDTSGRIEYVNPKFTQLTGYTLDEVRGQNPSILKSGDTDSSEYQRLWQTVSAGGEWHGVFHNRKKNGELYWESACIAPIRDGEGKITHFVAVKEDITEYKRLQEQFRRVFESAPSGMVMVDAEGKIVLTNPHTQNLFGYRGEELIGQPIELLVPERARDVHRAHRENFLREPQARIMGANRELLGRRKNGSEFPLEIGLSPVKTEHGEFVLAAIADVTARRQAEAEAKRHLDELAHVSRVASIGEMASGLAHEINQPLTAIVSYAEACRLMLQSGREHRKVLLSSLEQISKQGERAGDIIHRLREFVSKGKLERRPIDVNDLVDGVLDMLRHEIDRYDIGLRVERGEHVPKVNADNVQIEQVIFNLVRNAIEAMEPNEPGSRELIIGTCKVQAEGPAVEVFVSDTGEGLAAERAERVFDAFYSTKQHGMGLGLSITRTIVQAHGGRIWAVANKNRGATLRFTLPIGDTSLR
ncbi:MAG: PAS domain S-box protein [Acidiferrobacterales bacterium]|nr:PAS domain S-box protein [Acidiferrobacterales bacterium]